MTASAGSGTQCSDHRREPAVALRPPGLAGGDHAAGRRATACRSSARPARATRRATSAWTASTSTATRCRSRPKARWAMLVEYSAALFWEFVLAWRVLAPTRLRRHPRLQPAGPDLPGRRVLQALRQEVRLRPPRHQPGAVRGQVRPARLLLPADGGGWSAGPSARPTCRSPPTSPTGASPSSAAACGPSGCIVVRSGPMLERLRIVPPVPALKNGRALPGRLRGRDGQAGRHRPAAAGRARTSCTS